MCDVAGISGVTLPFCVVQHARFLICHTHISSVFPHPCRVCAHVCRPRNHACVLRSALSSSVSDLSYTHSHSRVCACGQSAMCVVRETGLIRKLPACLGSFDWAMAPKSAAHADDDAPGLYHHVYRSAHHCTCLWMPEASGRCPWMRRKPGGAS